MGAFLPGFLSGKTNSLRGVFQRAPDPTQAFAG